ncbi:UNVERIFIED_CONTAM: hypothetical protein Slati_1900300 [Sesamum latifolium]|uniref:Uncharacterized protein n=1 Tax=Sesamum latifolium TaxID=2727402 RepID=A0AAW2X0N7_9LAMI
MFFSKFDEETTANRKLAKELVDKWVIMFLSMSAEETTANQKLAKSWLINGVTGKEQQWHHEMMTLISWILTMNKKLQQLKAPKQKQLQATKLGVRIVA